MASMYVTPEEIRQKLLKDNKWVERALVALHKDRAFPPYDEFLIDLADLLETDVHKHLSAKQLAAVRRDLSRHYVPRLSEIAVRRTFEGEVRKVLQEEGLRIADFPTAMAFTNAACAIMNARQKPAWVPDWQWCQLFNTISHMAVELWQKRAEAAA